MGLREQVSLLQAHGHPHAGKYPVPRLWTEVRFVRTRLDRQLANQMILTQLAVGGLLEKKANAAFKRAIKKLTEE